MRLIALALCALVACGGDDTDKKAKNVDDTDTGDPGILPPTSCPVGDVAITKARVDADLALLDAWNAIRLDEGTCGAVAMDPEPALPASEPLMWTARCWADDLSRHGQPPASNQFSDGTPLAQAAEGQGYAGFIGSWAAVGDVPDEGDAFSQWLAAEGDGCERLWAEATSAGIAASDVGGTVVVVRLTGLDVR